MSYKDSQKQKAYQNSWLKERRRRWLQEHGPCVSCGSWEQLEIDHVNPTKKLTHRVWSWSTKRRDLELSKCVVRCTDCHQEKTAIENSNAFSGKSNPNARLTDDDVAAIRSSSQTRSELAARFNVSSWQIWAIRTGRRWNHAS